MIILSDAICWKNPKTMDFIVFSFLFVWTDRIVYHNSILDLNLTDIINRDIDNIVFVVVVPVVHSILHKNTKSMKIENMCEKDKKGFNFRLYCMCRYTIKSITFDRMTERGQKRTKQVYVKWTKDTKIMYYFVHVNEWD